MKKIKIILDNLKEFELDIMELFYHQYIQDYQLVMDQDPLSTYPTEAIIEYQDNDLSFKVMNEALSKYHIIHYEFI